MRKNETEFDGTAPPLTMDEYQNIIRTSGAIGSRKIQIICVMETARLGPSLAHVRQETISRLELTKYIAMPRVLDKLTRAPTSRRR